jgi:hydrogenase nickel incorporation protein HypB
MAETIGTKASELNGAFIFHLPPEGMIREHLSGDGVLAVRLIGPPGSGKTELIGSTIRHLSAPQRVAVIVINPAAHRDAERLRAVCERVYCFDAPTPRAAAVWQAVQKIPVAEIDLILIEACGGLAPLEDLGQDATVAAFSIGGGDDKPAEYHRLLENSSVVLLTQSDMLKTVKFNESVVRQDIHDANAAAEIIEVSATNGAGMVNWIEWLEQTRAAKSKRHAPQRPEEPDSGRYFG